MRRTRKHLLVTLSMFGLAVAPVIAADTDPSIVRRPLVVPGAGDEFFTQTTLPEPAPAPQPQPAAPQNPAAAQPAPDGQDAAPKFTEAQLKELVGPIALYPDPLLAQVLTGATYPLEIVQAARFVKANANDAALKEKIAAQPWDPSVQALAHYPGVIAMMDEHLEWTQSLGAAFLYQQEEVMAAVQTCRATAQAAGNLATTKEQTVVTQDKVIEIVPADPEIIYVPQYVPEYVYVERPVYVSSYITFSSGCHVGSWLHLGFDWHAHHVCYGGWYHKHHNHHHHDHRRDVHVYNHRDSHDDHGHRYGDAWKRDSSRGGPQVRTVSVNDARFRSGDRDRHDHDHRSDDSRSRQGFRAASPSQGSVRTVPGYSRPASRSVTVDRDGDTNRRFDSDQRWPGRDDDDRRNDDRRSDDRGRAPQVTTPVQPQSPAQPDQVTSVPRAAVKPTPTITPPTTPSPRDQREGGDNEDRGRNGRFDRDSGNGSDRGNVFDRDRSNRDRSRGQDDDSKPIVRPAPVVTSPIEPRRTPAAPPPAIKPVPPARVETAPTPRVETTSPRPEPAKPRIEAAVPRIETRAPSIEPVRPQQHVRPIDSPRPRSTPSIPDRTITSGIGEPKQPRFAQPQRAEVVRPTPTPKAAPPAVRSEPSPKSERTSKPTRDERSSSSGKDSGRRGR